MKAYKNPPFSFSFQNNMSVEEKIRADRLSSIASQDHPYAQNENKNLKNVKFDHNYSKASKETKQNDEEEKRFFFHNLEDFPEIDKTVVKKRFVQSMALNGACCDIIYEIRDDVIKSMGDYVKDIQLLKDIYIREFTAQLSHTKIFKVNPHIHAFFSNGLYDPEKGLYDPDTGTYDPNITNRDSEIERHIWLTAFQVDSYTNLSELTDNMLAEFASRIESTQSGPSNLIFLCFTSTILAYSLNFYEYAGCDSYANLPACITTRKAITPIISPDDDCFVQCVKHHFRANNILLDINFRRIKSPINFFDIRNFEEDNVSISINVLSFEYHNDTEQLSHFEPKYHTTNFDAEHKIALLYHDHHFSYVHDMGKLLGKVGKDNHFRKAYWCFSCLSTFWNRNNLEVIFVLSN